MQLEVLTDNAKKLLPYFKGQRGFCLAGGTAIALQIGHRVSVDFDFFSEKKISKNLLSTTQKRLSRFSTNILVNNSDELTMIVNQVKLTYLYYPFGLVGGLVRDGGIAMLNLTELAATKAYTVGRRGEAKDYIDLYFLLAEGHVKLKSLLSTARKKYAGDFNDRLFLEQLLYLDDIKLGGIKILRGSKLTKKIMSDLFNAQIKGL